MRPRHIRWFGALALALGCGDDGGGSGEDSGTDTGETDTTSTVDTSGSGPTSSATMSGSQTGTSTASTGVDTGTSATDSTTDATGTDDSTGTTGQSQTGTRIVLVGHTNDGSFPTTSGAEVENYIGGPTDGFVVAMTLADDDTVSVDWATFVGGTAFEQVRDVALGVDGSVYVTGRMESTDMPTTAGVFQPSHGGGPMEAYLVKYTPDGVLELASYLGGDVYEVGYAISVDDADEIYISGRTSSTNFPTTNGSFQPQYAGGGTNPPYFGGDFFVTKIAADATDLVWSTFVGGSADDMGRGRNFVDGDGNVYVQGRTLSDDFPTSNGAFSTTKQGGSDGGIAKLSADGSDLLWGTYLGGNADLDASIGGLVALGNGEVVLCGYTNSGNFPASGGAAQATHGGGFDGYLARMSADGSQVLAATYLGGSGYEECQGVAVDQNGDLVALVYTNSNDFPTQNAMQPSRAGPSDFAVVKLGQDLDQFAFATYFGGSNAETADSSRIWVDDDNAIFLMGNTDSTDLPVTANAPQDTFGGGQNDAFIARLSNDGQTVLFATYYGANGNDFGRSFAIAPAP